MKIQAERLIDAPRDAVWKVIADPERVQDAVESRGGTMTPRDAENGARAWDVAGTVYGIRIDAPVTALADRERGMLTITLRQQSLAVDAEATCTGDDAGPTALSVTVELAPRGVRGRLIAAPLKLARPKMEAALDAALDRLAARMAERHGG